MIKAVTFSESNYFIAIYSMYFWSCRGAAAIPWLLESVQVECHKNKVRVFSQLVLLPHGTSYHPLKNAQCPLCAVKQNSSYTLLQVQHYQYSSFESLGKLAHFAQLHPWCFLSTCTCSLKSSHREWLRIQVQKWGVCWKNAGVQGMEAHSGHEGKGLPNHVLLRSESNRSKQTRMPSERQAMSHRSRQPLKEVQTACAVQAESMPFDC